MKYVARETLVDVARDRAETHGDEIWLRYLVSGEVTGATVELTYGALAQRATAIAAELQRHGEAGDRALLLFPSGLEFVTAFFGCLFAGIIPVPAYPPDVAKPERSLAKLHAIAADCRPRFALTTAEHLPLLARVAPPGAHCLATDTCDPAGAPAWRAPALSDDSIAFVQYTSGSTGAPKGAVLRHRQVMANRRSIEAGMGPVGTVVGWLPIFHDMGLIGNVLQTLCAGTSLVLMSPVAFLKRPARWLEAISQFRATTSGGPNFAYDLCVRRVSDADRAQLDLASWKVAFCGAEPVREATYRRFTAAFEPRGFSRDAFYPCYGLAEATLFVTGHRRGTPAKSRAFCSSALDRGEVVEADDSSGADRRVLVSCGTPSPTEEVRIVDPDRLVAATGIGEIWVRGPGIASGYWGRTDEDGGVFTARLADGDGPFLRTGDLGFLHGGDLFIAGRKKDMIIAGGRNLFPQDLEATIEAAVPALRKGCCAAFSVEADGDEKLCIMAEHDGSPEAETVRAIQSAIAEHHQAAVFEVVLVAKGAIPKTSSGKVERHACRRAYARRS
jgi:acyl-CoA synthetase (AMP-forming)/AMP-acid ligase II